MLTLVRPQSAKSRPACSILDRDTAGPSGWRPVPRPTVFTCNVSLSSTSSSDDCMVTPSSTVGSPTLPDAVPDKCKRKASRELEAELSASPLLEGNKNRTSNNKMQRTPQTNLTQTKLTGFTVAQGPAVPPGAAQSSLSAPTAVQTSEQPDAVLPTAGTGEQLTADFFRNLIGENTKQITSRIDNLSQCSRK